MKHTLKSLLLSAGLAISFASTAVADKATEAYVNKNANAALQSLSSPELSHSTELGTFEKLMSDFADMERISNFVIGKYARRFSESDLKAYRAAYSDYALATYQNQLDKFRGQKLDVLGSVDTSDGRYSVVQSVVKRSTGDLPVNWRVMISGSKDKKSYQVVDVSLDVDGNEIWLAIEQRAQFLSLLDRSNGDAKALIAKIKDLTKELQNNQGSRQANATVTNEASDTEDKTQAG